MVGTLFNILALAAFSTTHYVAALPAVVTVTVPSPFFNSVPTPLPAAVVGVDSQGHTTYAIDQDAIEGSSTAAFITGTLVAGADAAAYTLSFASQGLTLAAGFDCALNGGNAVCSGLDDNSHIATATASVGTLLLDVTQTASGSTPTQSKNSSARGISASVFMLISPLLMYYLI